MFSASRRTPILVSGLLLIASLVLMPGLAGRNSPLNLGGSVASADANTPRSYAQFIRGAYVGALGRLPTCAEEQAEFDALVYATASGNRLGEARRFVSMLFETQASYDSPDDTVYCQTPRLRGHQPGLLQPVRQLLVGRVHHRPLPGLSAA